MRPQSLMQKHFGRLGFIGIKFLLVSGFLLVANFGCENEKNQPAVTASPEQPEAAATDKSVVTQTSWTEVALHAAVRSSNPEYTGNGMFKMDPRGRVIAIGLDNCNVSDLSPFATMKLQGLYLQSCPIEDISILKGMPLVELAIENTKVKDISALAGNTTLKKLYLSNSAITDLSPLKGMPIDELNLVNTPIEDLRSLASLPVRMLWLTGSPVEDISPLRKCSRLESLTLHQTKVQDLSPLSGSSLQRLHIGETPVSDLSPLAGMRLTRLVFDRQKITRGIEAIQAMPSLKELGSRFDDGGKDLVHPAVYWSREQQAKPGN